MRPENDTFPFRVGLIGADLGPSLSPALHEREAEELGVAYAYERIDISELRVPAAAIGSLLADAHGRGLRGVNVTHPCKQLVVEHLTELSPKAVALGAVNTVVFDGADAVGYNTDWGGFQESFVRGLSDVVLGSVVLLGAGGAGSAVAHAVLSLGADRLMVSDTQPGRARHLAAALAERYGDGRSAVADDLAGALAQADGLINATPIGMEARLGIPLAAELLHGGLWVADVVYRPLETELLRQARELGCRTLDGGGMAVFQAALSFALFTGLEPDGNRMLRHFAELTEPNLARR